MEIKEKLKIPYPILVEGKYDRLRLLSVIDAQIITTDGFGIFNKKEKTALLRALAKAGQIIVLTDSDGAGKLIRSHVSGCLPRESIINLYTPEIFGKEKRKAEPSAEGKLGVEGMERELLYNLFLPYTAGKAGERGLENPISKTDFYEDGLTGKEGSSERRDALCAQLGLPLGMTPNALLAALRVLCTYEEYCALVGRN